MLFNGHWGFGVIAIAGVLEKGLNSTLVDFHLFSPLFGPFLVIF